MREPEAGEQTGGAARDCEAQNGPSGGAQRQRRNARVQSCREEQGASGVLGTREGLGGEEKGKQVQFALLRLPASLGQRREERAVPVHKEGERPEHPHVPAPHWALS